MVVMSEVYAKNDAFVHREIAGESILVPVYGQVANMEAIFTLNEVATSIWNLIDGKRTLADVSAAVVDEYDVEQNEVDADLMELVQALVSVEAVQAL